MSRGVWIRGRVLIELRDLAGLSQEELAFTCEHRERCKVTREEISAYEREIQRPTRAKLNAIIAVLKVSEEDRRKLIRTPALDALDALYALIRGDGAVTDRSQALKVILAGLADAGLAALDRMERIAYDLRPHRPDRVDSMLIAAHEDEAAALASRYRNADPRVALPTATVYADSVLELLARPMTDRDRARLYVVAVGVHAQTGLWACHASRWTDAYRHLATACDLAACAGNPPLRAQALGAFSYLFSSAPRGGRGGDPDRALELLDQALDQAADADSFTRGWLATWRADQHATLGDVGAALADAETAHTQLGVGEDRAEGFFSRATFGYAMDGHLGSVQAVTLALAGHTYESDRTFAQVLGCAANLRRRVYSYGHHGMVLAVAREPEGACDALTRSLDLAQPAGCVLGIERILGVRDSFDPSWADLACVRRLDDRLRHIA
ncbi:MAG: helix-turn-helix domain-containing protein [Egibacteraceae bacterium]